MPLLNSSFGERSSFSAMITRWVLAFEAALGFVIIAVIAKMISMLVETTLVAVGTIFAIPIRLKRFEGRGSVSGYGTLSESCPLE